MLKAALRHFPLVLVIIVTLSFVGFALAEESGASAEVGAEATVNVTPNKLVRPLDLIRAKVGEVKKNAVDAKVQLRANTKVELQNAPPGEKRDVMKNALDARVDIAKTRIASTTGIRMQLKGLVRQHAGLIKERFALALRQFEKLFTRIETRIEKLKAEGAATATVEADLALAKTANAEAKVDVQAVANFVASVDDSADRESVKSQLQVLIKEAQASIKAAHQALQKVVRGLVALAKENKSKAGASVEVDTSASSQTSE